IIVSSHYLDELSKIATHYGFVDKGTIIKEISAEELNKKMEQKIELKVTNTKDFVKYFEERNISYEVIDKNTINVYGKINLSKFINELSKNNLEAEDIIKSEESLENYYMNLIGGAHND
ncbi:MAG: ABC transporter ATP-binding protein, partial [Bacilli bacterium]|nr:ABC transporter ATP-binding protein [Bacilli bacterium]